MKNFLRWLSRQRFPYEPLIDIEISKDRLLHNLKQFQKLAPEGRVIPVLKSNAYGHGLFEIARILDKEKLPAFAIDSYFEAVALYSAGIKTPLLVIGYTRPETIMNSKLKNASFTITQMETLRALDKLGQPVRINLKIDTGMNRQGILPNEIQSAIQLIKQSPKLILEGISSHLCDADNPDQSFTEKQIVAWNSLVGKFKSEFPHLKLIHLSATDGHLFASKIEANASRLGIGLYGISENQKMDSLGLLPVLELKTIITGIKKIKKGQTVGYRNSFTACKDTTIATIPVGYFEGLNNWKDQHEHHDY
jgi:alanine racemase